MQNKIQLRVSFLFLSSFVSFALADSKSNVNFLICHYFVSDNKISNGIMVFIVSHYQLNASLSVGVKLALDV